MSLAGDLDLVVGEDKGKLYYIENTGNSTAPVFVFLLDFSHKSSYSYSYSYLYDDDYDDDGDVAAVPPSNASSYSYLYDDDYVGDDNAARRRVTSSQSNYWNPFDGIDVGWNSAPALGDIDGDGTLRPRPSIDKLRPYVFVSRAGDLDLVVGGESGKLIYMENTGTSTEPEFAEFAEFAVSSYSYLYDDDYVDDDDEVATMPPSNASSYSYLYDDDYVDDDYVPTMPPSRQSKYSNLFAGIDVGY